MSHLCIFIDTSKNFDNFELFKDKLVFFLETEKKLNPSNLLSIITFNNKYEIIHSNQLFEHFDCSLIKKISVSDQGLALYDTLSSAIKKVMLFNEVMEMKNDVKAVVFTHAKDSESMIVNQASMLLQIAMAKIRKWKFYFASTDMTTALIFKNLNCDESFAYNLDEKSLMSVFEQLKELC